MTEEGSKIRAYLRAVLDTQDLDTLSVGVSGSAVLSWYLNSMSCHPKVFPLPTFVALDELKPPMPFLWKDVDVFVCGRYSQSYDTFQAFMQSVMHKTSQTGYTIHEIGKHSGYSMLQEGAVLDIVEISVVGISSPITFIGCSGADNVCQAVENFDIDICQMIYIFRHDTYLAASNVKANALKGSMALTRHSLDLIACEKSGGSFGVKTLRNIKKRLMKYESRGFFHWDVHDVRNRINKRIMSMKLDLDDDETLSSDSSESERDDNDCKDSTASEKTESDEEIESDENSEGEDPQMQKKIDIGVMDTTDNPNSAY